MSVPAKNRALVYARDNYECVVCGRSDTLTLQHRINRGMGGSKRLDRVEALVTMCSQHNMQLEQDAEFARTGRRLGWKLERWENPLERPVFYIGDGAFWFLTGRGTRIKEEQ